MLAMGYRSRALRWCAATTLVFTSALPQSSAESPCQPLEATSTLPSKTSVDPNAPKNAFAGVFYDNNFSYLTNPEFQGPFLPGDSLKTLNDGKLAIGGEYRSRFHHENNMRGFGLTGVDDQFWLSRLRLFSDYQPTERIRLFGEYLYADSGGETFASRSTEENRGEIQNLFADVTLFDLSETQVVGRAGRQELLFGNQRLIAPLDWVNSRRTFDGYRVTVDRKSNKLDLFYTNPVIREDATSGANKLDRSYKSQDFYGAYLTDPSIGNSVGISTLETYYLGYRNQDEGFSFHTLGNRIVGKAGELLYEYEGGYQFGNNSDRSSHHAAFLTGGLGKEFNFESRWGSWTPTIWGWYDWASGGDSALLGPGDNGFNHLFPLAHKYNGYMDLFGRRNLHDVNVQFILPAGKRNKFMLWYHYFFLDQLTTPYSVGMKPYNVASNAVSRDLGHEIDLLWTIAINPRNCLMIGYSHFHAGDYYQTPNTAFDGNADFFYTQYQVQF